MNEAHPVFKLAVAIPTYNRAHLLDDLLWNLGPQIDRHADQCACYVVDNCSTDETAEVVKRHQARWKNIFYHRNEANLGLIRNISRGITVPDARWSWLVGDDDVPMPYAVEAVLADLDRLDESRTTFLMLKGAKVDPERRFLPATWDQFTTVDPPLHLYDDGGEIISVGGVHYLAWLSELVVNRAHWDQALFDRVYRETDLYTFVTVLLNVSFGRVSAFSRRLFIFATDRGSRAYYFSKTAIARVCEFPEIEALIVKKFGMARARVLLRNHRRGWFRERMVCVLKLAVFSDEYAEQQHLLDRPVTPFVFERFCIRAITAIARVPWVRAWLTRVYRSRRADRIFTRETINRSA